MPFAEQLVRVLPQPNPSTSSTNHNTGFVFNPPSTSYDYYCERVGVLSKKGNEGECGGDGGQLESEKTASFNNHNTIPAAGPDKFRGLTMIWFGPHGELSIDSSSPSAPNAALFVSCERPASLVILYIHNSDEDVSSCIDLLRVISQRFCVHVLAVEFPGYGGCKGVPTLGSVERSAFAAFRFAVKSLGVPANRIVVWGKKAGASAAAAVCSQSLEQNRPAGLILQTPFMPSAYNHHQQYQRRHFNLYQSQYSRAAMFVPISTASPIFSFNNSSNNSKDNSSSSNNNNNVDSFNIFESENDVLEKNSSFQEFCFNNIFDHNSSTGNKPNADYVVMFPSSTAYTPCTTAPHAPNFNGWKSIVQLFEEDEKNDEGTADIRNVKSPTLMVSGHMDTIVPPCDVESLFDMCRADCKVLQLRDRMGHTHYDVEYDLLAPVEAFFTSYVPAFNYNEEYTHAKSFTTSPASSSASSPSSSSSVSTTIAASFPALTINEAALVSASIPPWIRPPPSPPAPLAQDPNNQTNGNSATQALSKFSELISEAFENAAESFAEAIGQKNKPPSTLPVLNLPSDVEREERDDSIFTL